MPSHGSRSMTASDQSDLKKLKSRYSSQLATLRELFADWSDDDLLFALQEVEGDLDLAIDRISEGHVSQWGEVKSRKSKKEAAQKAKAAAAPVPPSSSNQMSSSASSSYRPERTQPPRGNNDRSKRGGRHGSRGQRQPTTTQSQAPAAATWGTSAPTKSFQPDTGSWASIASTKMNDKGWNANTDSGSGWDAAAPNTTTTTNGWDDKEPTQEIKTESEEKPASTTAEAKTWASLLKSKPKPVEAEKPKQEPETSEKSGWDEPKDAAKDGWDTKDEGGWDTKDNWDNKDSWDAPSVPADPWTSSTTEPVQEAAEAATAEAPKESEPEPVNEPEQHVNTTTEDETPKEEPVPKKSFVDRRPKQDAPVVLPNNGTSSLSSIGVKFGSLTLDDNAENNNEINNTTLQAEMRVPDEIQQPSQPQQERLDTFATAPLQNQPQAAPQQQQQQQQPLASEPVPQQQAPIQQQPQHTLPQQPLFGMDHLASGYSSYLPNQPPAGVSGFGVSPMGSLPDYGLYGTDAHRAAMLQGYYDPAAVYNQSPSATHAYQPRDKQDGVPQHSGAQTPGATAAAAAAAQMYPMNMPYYQYYYMPSQFGYQQNAAAAAYGQPFMNKSMYPTNMYQQGTAKPNAANPAGTATSPYGAAAASPYSQTMYSAAMSAGYDDMTAPGAAGLQHNLGGLQDYQKMYQQQLPGFLGGGQQQQPPVHHHQQPSQQPAQQPASATGNKNDKAGNAAGAAGGSNGHHHAQQQQQPYPGNYFGGGSFPTSYQQQYPQQQQHFPHFPQQQQQQAPAAQQPSPMGRQQPYWSQ